MKTAKIIRVMVALVLLVVCGNATSYARAQTQIDAAPISFGSLAVNGSQPLVVPQFNASLGTLISVDLQLDGTLSSGSVMLMNANASSVNLGMYGSLIQSFISVDDAAQNFANDMDAADTSPFPQNLMSYNINGVIGAGQTEGFSFSQVMDSEDDTYTDTSILDAFTGSGQIDLTVTTTSTFSGDGLTGVTLTGTGISASDSLSGEVIYNYDPTAVPEPSTLSLFLAGLSVLGVRFLPILHRKR